MAEAPPPPPADAAAASGTDALGGLFGGAELNENEKAQAKTMPVRQYLESKVVPLLLQGMQRLVVERPVDPVEFLADFLHKNNPRKKCKEGECCDAGAAPPPPPEGGGSPPPPPPPPA